MELNAGLLALVVVFAIRFLVPLTILKWPLGGFLLAILGDISDVMILQRWPDVPIDSGYYHHFDKFFDTYYLFFGFLASRRWPDTLAKKTAAFLFGWRVLGFAVFELTAFRAAFVLAPNIFEHFYLFGAVVHKWFSDYRLNFKRLVFWLLLLGLPKVVQEYFMHYRNPGQTWVFFREHVFFWLYDQ